MKPEVALDNFEISSIPPNQQILDLPVLKLFELFLR